MTKKEIDDFVLKHEDWIYKHIKDLEQYQDIPTLTEEEVNELYDKALKIIPQKVEYYANLMNVIPTKLNITHAKKRWGSCSYKNSTSFSHRVMLLPDDLIDYIVVHELSHIKEKNHSKNFYNVVEKYLPDYKEREKKLREIEKTLPR